MVRYWSPSRTGASWVRSGWMLGRVGTHFGAVSPFILSTALVVSATLSWRPVVRWRVGSGWGVAEPAPPRTRCRFVGSGRRSSRAPWPERSGLKSLSVPRYDFAATGGSTACWSGWKVDRGGVYPRCAPVSSHDASAPDVSAKASERGHAESAQSQNPPDQPCPHAVAVDSQTIADDRDHPTHEVFWRHGAVECTACVPLEPESLTRLDHVAMHDDRSLLVTECPYLTQSRFVGGLDQYFVSGPDRATHRRAGHR